MNIPVLYEKLADCCGCGVCSNVCPKDAIRMQRDENGVLYPVIQKKICVGCAACTHVCAFQSSHLLPRASQAYAVQAREESALNGSASGGVFALLAQEVLRQGGAVVGCAFQYTDEGLMPQHVMVRDVTELQALQGSKYVQSVTGDIFREVRAELETGKNVLFSGTPCQVDGLKRFLGQDLPNLWTVDLVCHGVPGDGFFRDYVGVLEKCWRKAVADIVFRDKSSGWGLQGHVSLMTRSGEERERVLIPAQSSYYNLFLRAETYRDSCYQCKYAGLERPGDLTLGDFWGVESAHPEYLKRNGGDLCPERGISCVLVNSERGRSMLERLEGVAWIKPSCLEAVSRENGQLRQPASPGKHRETVLRLYRTHGYWAVSVWSVWRRICRKLSKMM